MADRTTLPGTGSLDAHPDFPEFFNQAREQVWGEYAQRYERAASSGNTAAAERLQSQIDREARRRAVVAARTMLNHGVPGLQQPATLTGRENTPPVSSGQQMIEEASRGIDWTAPGPRPAAPPSEHPITDVVDGGPTMEQVEAWLRGVAQESTGIPAAARAGQAAAEGEYGQAATNAAMAVAPFVLGPASGAVARGLTSEPVQAVGRAIAARPVAAGATVAGGTTLATTAQPQDIPAPSAADREMMQSLQGELKGWQDQLTSAQSSLAELQRQRREIAAQMDAEFKGKRSGRGGRGPIYDSLKSSLDSLDGQIEAQNRTIKGINDAIGKTNEGITQVRQRMSPEYRMELERKRLEEAEKERQRRSGMTTRELASDYLGYLPAVSIPAAIVAGGVLRGRALSNWNRQIGEIDKKWGRAIERANAATPGSPAFSQALTEAERLMADFERLVHQGRHAGTGSAIGVGAGLGFVGATLPEEIDLARAALGSDLWKKLKEEVIKDLPTFGMYVAKAGLSTALGGAAGHIGRYPVDMTRINRGAPTGYAAETEGLQRVTPPIPLEPSPTSPQLPPGSSSLPALPAGMATPAGRPAGPPRLPSASPVGGGALTRPEPNVTFGPQRFQSDTYRFGSRSGRPPTRETSQAPANLPELPSLEFRRWNPGPLEGGHWVPPGERVPAWAGSTETWVSQQGRNIIYRDQQGRWRQRINDGPSRQITNEDAQRFQRTYRRISSVDDIMWTGRPLA